MSGVRVVGVDACRSGWVGVVLAADGAAAAYTAPSIAELVGAVEVGGRLDVVGIDIPIGLPDERPRQADLLARERVGRLWPSVFLTPIRAALLAASHAAGSAVSRERTGAGISVQAFGLRVKLLEVDGWVRGYGGRVVEMHPEVSFATLAGRPLTAGKRSWAGATYRRRLLADAGIALADDLGPAGVAGFDDVLDAAVLAWSARRVATEVAVSLPDPPERFSDGLPAAIWF